MIYVNWHTLDLDYLQPDSEDTTIKKYRRYYYTINLHLSLFSQPSLSGTSFIDKKYQIWCISVIFNDSANQW